MRFGEALRFSFSALLSNKVRSALTALGLLIGNASVILVVTISLTSRDYILEQISGVGSNLITAYFDAGNREATTVAADFVNLSDVAAVKEALGARIRAATGIMSRFSSIVIDGRPRDVKVIGCDAEYARVRNLIMLAGRPSMTPTSPPASMWRCSPNTWRGCSMGLNRQAWGAKSASRDFSSPSSALSRKKPTLSA